MTASYQPREVVHELRRDAHARHGRFETTDETANGKELKVEYPDMVFGPDGYWLACGYCGWDGPIRGTRRTAARDRWWHPSWWCWLKALWRDAMDWRIARARAAGGETPQ